MRLDDVHQVLKSTGYPLAFHHFEEPPPLPYMVYLTPSGVTTYADDQVYSSASHYQVELYTERKDLTAEQAVEAALAVFCWEKSQDYIAEEMMYRTVYEFEEIE